MRDIGRRKVKFITKKVNCIRCGIAFQMQLPTDIRDYGHLYCDKCADAMLKKARKDLKARKHYDKINRNTY